MENISISRQYLSTAGTADKHHKFYLQKTKTQEYLDRYS
jgi:hypothetical protein